MKWFAFILVLSQIAGAAPEAPSAEAILKKADAIRNPDGDYVMKVDVTSSFDDPRTFEVYIHGSSRTLVKTLSPERDKERAMLMVDENMWAYVPNLKRGVRVALSQKLTGQAANGDISRTRWAGDYDAKIESETPEKYVLFLEAKKKGLTYEKIRATIDKKTYRPLSAEYLSLSGKLLKTASFSGYKSIGGNTRPTEIEIKDAVRTDQKSTLAITSMEVKPLPASQFSLERFQGR